jgi:uncharacterized coiled-coil DUF342 family protein
MEEKQPQGLRERMEQRSAEKKALISSLRAKNSEIAELERTLAISLPKETAGKTSPGRIQEKLDKLEFSIATSAYTSAQEKDLVRQVSVLKKELDGAKKESGEWENAKKIRDALRARRDERRGIRETLDAISKELDELYKEIIEQGMKRAADRKMREEKKEEYEAREKKRSEKKKFAEEKRKESEPYMKEIDPFVSMEEIAEVKKKNGE